VDLLQHEMKWTISFFQGKRKLWEGLALKSWGHPGLVSYAHKQAALWARFENQAEECFKGFSRI
jgi:hypothetical protein